MTGGTAENCEATSAIPGHRQPETATCLLQQTARRRDAEVVASIVMVICFANRHYALLRLLHFFSSRSLTNMPVSDSAAVKQIRGKEIILKKTGNAPTRKSGHSEKSDAMALRGFPSTNSPALSPGNGHGRPCPDPDLSSRGNGRERPRPHLRSLLRR